MGSSSFWSRQAGRRAVLKGGALASFGIAGAALVGCGGGDDEADATGTPSTSSTATATGTAASEDYINADLLSLNDPNFPLPFVYPQLDLPPKAGGTFRMATRYDIGSFDPTTATSNVSIAVVTSVSQTLVGLKHGPAAHPLNGEVIPRLAKSWEISDDGLTYTFHLNEGVKYQDIAPVSGRDFSSEDVVQVYQRFAGEGVSRSVFDNVAEMAAVDPVTFQVRLNKPQPDFIFPLSTRLLPIYAIELVEDMKNISKVVGTGAYQLKEARKGERIVYEKNPNYWGTPGWVDGAEWTIQPDASAALAMFRVGQVDYADGMVRSLRESIAFHEDNPEFPMEGRPPVSGGMGFSLNLQNPKYQDERVRQALSLMLNRDAYIASLGAGYGTAHLPVLPWNYVFDELPGLDATPYRHLDLDEAKKLLDAAGATGLEMNAINYYRNDSEVGFYVESLSQGGVKLNVQNMDIVAFNAQWQTNTFEDAAGGGLTGANFYADAYYYNLIHSQSGANTSRINDPEIDAWTEAQSTEMDPAARRALLRQIWDKMEAQAYKPLESPQTYPEAYAWYPHVMGWAPCRASNAVTMAADVGTYLEDLWLNV